MKKFFILATVMLIIGGLIFILGCSDDEETTEPVVKQTGDTNAVDFEAAGEAMGFVDEVNNMMFGMMFEIMDTIYNDPGFPASSKSGLTEFSAGVDSDTLILTYHSGTNYWYLFAQSVDTESVDLQPVVITMTFMDSLQFLHSGTPVQWPDSALLTGVKHGVSLVFTSSDSLGGVTAHQLVTVSGDIPNAGDAEIDGISSFDIFIQTDDSTPYCFFDVNLGANFVDIMANLEGLSYDGCPSSGSASYSGAMSLGCVGDTSFTYNDNWSVVQTFSGTSMHYVVENSTYRWEFDDDCGPSIMGPDNRIGEFLSHFRK